MTDSVVTTVDVCICTFRRGHLLETLRSVARLDRRSGAEIRVIIADNDETPSAAMMVEAIASSFPFPIHYIHSPARNISIARNACLDATTADFAAFVDDDETVSPQWIDELLAVAGTSGADAVLGPVRAIYAADAPNWMRAGDFHSTEPVFVGDEIRTGYTCNVLIRRREKARGLRFNLARGRSGGEDTEYFSALHRAGGRIAYAPQALVLEEVPPARAMMSWLVARRVRMGRTHGRLLMEYENVPALRLAAVAGAKAAYCLALTAATAASPIRRRQNLLRGMLHLGVLGSTFGLREQTQYGSAEPRTEQQKLGG